MFECILSKQKPRNTENHFDRICNDKTKANKEINTVFFVRQTNETTKMKIKCTSVSQKFELSRRNQASPISGPLEMLTGCHDGHMAGQSVRYERAPVSAGYMWCAITKNQTEFSFELHQMTEKPNIKSCKAIAMHTNDHLLCCSVIHSERCNGRRNSNRKIRWMYTKRKTKQKE